MCSSDLAIMLMVFKQPGANVIDTVDHIKAALANMHAMGRVIQPEEVAALCLFLTSDAAASITGSAYNIDGGEQLIPASS